MSVFDTLFHSIDYTKALTISNVTLSSFFLFSILFFFFFCGIFFFAVSESLNRQCSEESIGKWRRAAYRSEIWLYIRTTFGISQKPGGTVTGGWRLIEGRLIEGILYKLILEIITCLGFGNISDIKNQYLLQLRRKLWKK